MKTIRGQAWGFDLFIATIIFITGIIIFYFYALNYPTEGQDKLESLSHEGTIIAENLLSSGFPADWEEDPDNVVSLGITDNGKINELKLQELYDLSIENYGLTKILFNTKYNYYFEFHDGTDIVPMETLIIEPDPLYIGQLIGSENAVNLIKISRFTIYNNKPATLNVYVWE